MAVKSFIPDQAIALFVKNISVFEEQGSGKTRLPFFADGYPGLMFQETESGLLVTPHYKRMPIFFLYGQTIKPVELIMEGAYQLVLFQLYPFVLKSFFNVDPRSLNDNCYDLNQIDNISIWVDRLQTARISEKRIELLNDFLVDRFREKKEALDFKVRQSLELIIQHKGQLNIKELHSELRVHERTFERRFIAEVGMSAKQFSKIIQFQQSLEQLTGKDYDKLTDVVYSNGFADQSHFIKVFKEFTGQTPKKFAIK